MPWQLLLSRPVMYAGAGLAIAASVWYWHARTDAAGYARGASETTAKYVARDAQAQAEADRKLDQARAEKVRVETAARVAHDEISQRAAHEKQKSENQIRDLNRRVADGFRLRDNYAGAGSGCRDGVPASGADTGKPASAGGSQLSEQVTRFLIAEAERADSMTRERNECVARLAADRTARP